MSRRRIDVLLPLLGVVALPLLAACKVTPVDDNRAPLPFRIQSTLDSYVHRPADGSAPLPPPVGSERPATTGAGEGEGGELRPAARELPKYLPLGHAGDRDSTPGLRPEDLGADQVKLKDRWRVGFPSWERGSKSDSPWDMSTSIDPYHQNVFKGDYPIPGTQNTFLLLEATSLSLYESRKVPTPSSVFPRASGNAFFFGKPHQTLLNETLLLTADLFQGETSFKPVDWRLFLRGALNWNHATVRENQALFADPARGTRRTDRHAALQQAFLETTIASINDKYDVIQARFGTQLFNSDFKGFMFFDEALGARFFGSLDDNRWQWNLGWFRRWDKDTNSGLNTFDSIKQNVFIANLYLQDVLEWAQPRWKSASWSRGLQAQVSYLHFDDEESVHYDENGFLVRPRAVGTPVPTERSVDYLGLNVEGHVGRLNITSSTYQAWGDTDFDEIAGRKLDIDAFFSALELSVDVDWMRFRMHGMYQQGDENPFDSTAEGFDAIFDNPVFAGGEFGFWHRNTVRLTGSGVGLVQRFSLLNSLRSSKDQGAPSYVNPGLILGGIGYDAQLTPHLKLITTASYLRFDDTSSIEYVLNQDAIGNEIGYDLSVGALWRPLLTDNVIVKGGYSALIPGKGFRDIYTADTLHAGFLELILTW